MPPFFTLPTYATSHKLSLPSTSFYQLLPLLRNFYATFTNFFPFLPPFNQLYTAFHQSAIVQFLFYLLTCTNATTSLDAILQTLIFSLSFSLTPSHKSNMNNSFRIAIVKIVIIIKIYIKKTPIFSKKCNSISICNNKYIVINKYSIINIFKRLI